MENKLNGIMKKNQFLVLIMGLLTIIFSFQGCSNEEQMQEISDNKLLKKFETTFRQFSPIEFSREEKLKIIEKPNLLLEILNNKEASTFAGTQKPCYNYATESKCVNDLALCMEGRNYHEVGSDEWIDTTDKCLLKYVTCKSKIKKPKRCDDNAGGAI